MRSGQLLLHWYCWPSRHLQRPGHCLRWPPQRCQSQLNWCWWREMIHQWLSHRCLLLGRRNPQPSSKRQLLRQTHQRQANDCQWLVSWSLTLLFHRFLQPLRVRSRWIGQLSPWPHALKRWSSFPVLLLQHQEPWNAPQKQTFVHQAQWSRHCLLMLRNRWRLIAIPRPYCPHRGLWN